MIPFEEISVDGDLLFKLEKFRIEIEEYRKKGEMDPVALAKLEEHFKASHVYNSAGIEGNTLTLQETILVLKEGIDISGKPLRESVEIRRLGVAFDFLKDLALEHETFREDDIRSLHRILFEGEASLSPGEYRNTGVIITGSEHRPPEPIEVGARMAALVKWINRSIDFDPILVSSVVHHEITNIHPFKDGNGRVSRLVMNLILLKRGYPICNIKKDDKDRPAYYDALAFADVGLFEPLVEIVYRQSANLFSEYVRIRQETERMEDWAKKWGSKEATILFRKESREFELWKSRIRQVFLEFEKAADMLNDQLDKIEIEFFDYDNKISLDTFGRFVRNGSSEHASAFAVSFKSEGGRYERFMFNYFRDWNLFGRNDRTVPLSLNYYVSERKEYESPDTLIWGRNLRLREMYFLDGGDFCVNYMNSGSGQRVRGEKISIAVAAQWFFDDILRNAFGLTDAR